MKPYLESKILQGLVAEMFERNRPVGAICRGVLPAARSIGQSGRSVLYGRKTTTLTRRMELSAWALTCLWLGHYYRTYPVTVEQEVTACLTSPTDFSRGPMSLLRDAPGNLDRGYTVRHGRYISARRPGDAHRFAAEFSNLL